MGFKRPFLQAVNFVGLTFVPFLIILFAHNCQAFIFSNLFGLGGSPPIPGDVLSPQICESFCRRNCLQGGFGGYLNIPGCFQFCDCDFYFPPPNYYY